MKISKRRTQIYYLNGSFKTTGLKTITVDSIALFLTIIFEIKYFLILIKFFGILRCNLMQIYRSNLNFPISKILIYSIFDALRYKS